MRVLPTCLVLSYALVAAASPARAQREGYTIRVSPTQQPDPRQLPRDVADEVIRTFNAPGTLRFSGMTRIPAARGIDGDVAVLGGPVAVAGRISGSLTVINGDLELESGAVIGGDILVVGGSLRGAALAEVTGEVREYRDVLRYRRAGEELVYAPQREMLSRWRRHRADASASSFVLSLGGTYNRIEGVPIVFGPRLNVRLGEGSRLVGDARLVMRTGENFSLDQGRFGYRAQGEVVMGSPQSNAGFGLRAFDQVAPVEPWPLRDYEAGWASFLLHNDYRDWYRRQGWGLYVAARPSKRLTVTVEGREESDASVSANDPWTLFNTSAVWRPNPAISDGRFRSLVTGLRLDTRNDRATPSSGVLVTAEFEAGRGSAITGPVDPTIVCITTPCGPASLLDDGKLTYQRLWVDARTYLQLTPAGRLNLRLAGGGRVGGDDLPLQRRVSLGYPDPLPGYRIRQLACGGETVTGNPALCDRAIVAQAELRTHLGFDFGPDWANDWGDEGEDRWEPLHVTGPDIVVFADAGYAWNTRTAGTPLDRIPSLKYWLPDVGVGLDLGPVGLYLAKSVGPSSRDDLTFTVRMGRRF